MNENFNPHENYPDSQEKIDVPTMKVIPLKKICMTIGQLPTAYLETMSYYEMLIWFIEYLKNNIIPTINNNAQAVQEVQSVVLALQNYINDYKDSIDSDVEELEEYMNNYFENLDVQEEINNKLDQMLEDGVLEQIIEQFLQLTSLICFDNVQGMKDSPNLANGSFAKTLGFHSKNDGGQGLYKIRTITNDDVVDEMSIISVYDDTLIAELITEDKINVKQFGAYGDKTHDDYASVQAAITYANNKGGGYVVFPDGNYLISDTLEINTTKSIILSGQGSRYAETNACLYFNVANCINLHKPLYDFRLENLNFYNNLPQSENTNKLLNVLDGDGYFARSIYRNLTLANFTYGLDFTSPNGNDFNDGMIIENVKFRTVAHCIKGKHLEASIINMCQAEPFLNNFIEINQTQGLSITNCIMRGLETQNVSPTIGIQIIGSSTSGKNLYVNNCISEDIDIFALISTPNTLIENCRYTINREPLNSPFIFGRYGGINPDNTTIKNMFVNYEVTSSVPNIKLLSGNETINSLTFNSVTSASVFVENSNLSIVNNNDSRRVLIKNQNLLTSYNNKRIFYGASSLKDGANAPDGSSWIINDILFCSYTSTGANRHNHIIGYIYTQTGSNVYKWIPINIGIDSMTYSEAQSTYTGVEVGQMSYDSTNGKPIWWNGSHWAYSDGTAIQ